MEHLIQIDKHAVIEDVVRTAEYIAAKSGDVEVVYDRVSIVDEDNELLDQYWQESLSQAAVVLRSNIKNMDTARDILSIRMETPIVPPVSVATIERELHTYFVDGIVGRWLSFTDVNGGNIHLDRAETRLTRIATLLHPHIRASSVF